MPSLVEEPKQGEDVRVLHRKVTDLVHGVNSLLNMTAIMQGSASGLGGLRIAGGSAEVRIQTNLPGEEVVGGGVMRRTTTVAVTSTNNPADVGEAIRWNGFVAPDALGTITFYVNNVQWGAPVTVVGGLAQSAIRTNLPSGTFTILARYSGGLLYNPAQGTMSQIVNAIPPPDITIASSNNPATEGTNVIWRVRLFPQNPVPPGPHMTGQVRFFIDGTQHGSSINIQEVTPEHYLAESDVWEASDEAHHYVITGRYLGNNDYGAVEANLNQFVRSNATTVLAVQPNPGIFGEVVHFHVTVRAPQNMPTPTGHVQLKFNNVLYQQHNLVNGAAHFTRDDLALGNYSVLAVYSGDTNYATGFSNIVGLSIQIIPQGHVTVPGIFGGSMVGGGFVNQVACSISPAASGFWQFSVQSPIQDTTFGTLAYTYINGVLVTGGFENWVTVQFVGGVCVINLQFLFNGPAPPSFLAAALVKARRQDGSNFLTLNGIPNINVVGNVNVHFP